VDNYCFYPRVVAFENQQAWSDILEEDGFWTSLKIYDTTITPPADITAPENRALREDLAQEYLADVLSTFRFDSVALIGLERETYSDYRGGSSVSSESDVDWRLVEVVDTSTYAPRDVNYISVNFGKLEIPREITELQGVFYYEELTGNPGSSDSLVILLDRIEKHYRSPLWEEIKKL
jgi:hypothetical protein